MNAFTNLLNDPPRWVIMWVIAVTVFYVGKTAAWLATARPKTPRPLWLTLGWWFAWPGMSLTGWGKPGKVTEPARPLWIAGTRNFLLGVLVLWGVARLFTHPLAAGWVGMLGFILIFHFGLLTLVTAFWRETGVNAKPVMRNPLASVSLAEFWGQRWNTSFRDLSHRVLFLPAARRWGESAALWVVFAVSGVVHELVITVPAGAGYGLPTAYFLFQAAGLAAERRYCRLPTTLKHIRTILFTALPAFFLFPPPFVEGVMVPFFKVIGALP